MIAWATLGKAAWVCLVVTWYILRWPFERRAKGVKVVDDRMRGAERARLLISLTGLGVIPAIYVASGQPRFASYTPHPAQIVCGVLFAAGAAVLFRLTHKALGRNWSVSLQLKNAHQLVTTGIYRHVRHPMYSAFWLMASAQLLLLPNWVAGPAGLVGFGTLFFSRLHPEEKMMEQAFGSEYRRYRERTKRVIPYIY